MKKQNKNRCHCPFCNSLMENDFCRLCQKKLVQCYKCGKLITEEMMKCPECGEENIIRKALDIVSSQIDRINKLTKICRMLKENVSHYDWVGFYLTDKSKKELILGPFVGEPTEHTRIAFGQGICGQAAATERTFVVQDVSKETNYLLCSPKVKAEIVVPIFKNKKIVGELDIDSYTLTPFTEKDTVLLERICEIVARLF
ncbi:MAG: GAF domain-containing protein [Candidatus Methanoperedens sp.]|nr:GAF domain-containing protein [Candidatus Methanoperedens sp.]